MNPLWFLDGTFWEKMYFVTMVVGVAIFMNFLFDIIPEVKKKFRELRKTAKVEYKKQTIESKKVTERWKEMIKKKRCGKKKSMRMIVIMITGIFILSALMIGIDNGENQYSMKASICVDDPSDTKVVILDYDFEKETVGTRPDMGYKASGATLNHTNVSITTTDIGGDYDNVMSWSTYGQTTLDVIGSVYIGHVITEEITVTYDINMYEGANVGAWDWGAGYLSVSLSQSSGSAGTTNVIFAPNNDTYVRCYVAGGAGIVTYFEQNTWHTVKVIANPTDDTMIYYVDDVYKHTQSYSHSNIQYINIVMNEHDLGDAQEIKVYFDNFEVSVQETSLITSYDPVDDRTGISLVFDDAYLNMTDTVLDIMGNEKASVGIIAEYADSENDFSGVAVMGWTEIQTLIDSGWEMMSHGWSHNPISAMSEIDMRWEFETSKSWIEDNTTADCRGFIYPASARTTATDAIMYEYYEYSRFTGDMEQRNINSKSIYYGTELTDWGYYTMGMYTPALVYGYHGFIGTMIHNVKTIGPYGEYDTSADALEQWVDRLVANNSRITTPSEYWLDCRNANDAIISTENDNLVVSYPDDSVNRTENNVWVQGSDTIAYGIVPHYIKGDNSVWSYVDPGTHKKFIGITADSYPFWVNITGEYNGYTIISWTTENSDDAIITYTLYQLIGTSAYNVYKDDVKVGVVASDNRSITITGDGDFELKQFNPYPAPFAKVMIALILIGVAAAIIMAILKIKDTGQILGG